MTNFSLVFEDVNETLHEANIIVIIFCKIYGRATDNLLVRPIGDSAFSGCKSLETIYIADSALSNDALKHSTDVIFRQNPLCKIKTGEILSWIPKPK